MEKQCYHYQQTEAKRPDKCDPKSSNCDRSTCKLFYEKKVRLKGMAYGGGVFDKREREHDVHTKAMYEKDDR